MTHRAIPFLATLCFALAGVTLAHSYEKRKWVDDKAREITATYTKVEGENVFLKMENGSILPFPIKKLRQPCQQYIANALSEEAKAPKNEKLNFEDRWPTIVAFNEDPDIVVISENAETNTFIYHSKNYEFKSDVKLNSALVRNISRLFEATYEYCRLIPLALTANMDNKNKLPILLFESRESYIKAGGPAMSGGVYIPRINTIMVPLTSLGLKKSGEGYTFNRETSFSTLAHELTHQLTPREYYKTGSMGWFSEGLAEYTSNTPYHNGIFRVEGNIASIKKSVVEYGKDNKGGANLGKEIKVGPLKDYMLQSYESFVKNARLNYAAGQLIVYYFIHMDGNGDAKRLKAFLKALREGKEGEVALAYLLDGRTFEQLEKEIVDQWKKQFVTFQFSK